MTNKPAETIALPEGRVINNSLFTMDQFNDKSSPSYKIEMAFDKGTLDAFYDQCLDAAVARWGKGADEDKSLVIPFLDGDELAAKREAKNKPGDAYKDKDVLRASTIYNRDGNKGPGGICVYGPDVSEILAVNQKEVYNGCYGVMAVTIGTYESNDGNNAIKLYLSAFQKTKDGDPLTSPRDHSVLFKPSGAAPAADTSGARRRRAG